MDEFVKFKRNGKQFIIKREYCVYCLINKKTLEIFYIGRTSNKGVRIRHHRCIKQNQNMEVKKYISMLHQNNIKYDFKVLKYFETYDASKSMERKLIEHYKPICNVQFNQ